WVECVGALREPRMPIRPGLAEVGSASAAARRRSEEGRTRFLNGGSGRLLTCPRYGGGKTASGGDGAWGCARLPGGEHGRRAQSRFRAWRPDAWSVEGAIAPSKHQSTDAAL